MIVAASRDGWNIVHASSLAPVRCAGMPGQV
jgi:hypothetical protein